MSNISRRQFLKGAGVATLAVAAAGVLAGCSNVPDKPTPGVPDKTVHIYYMIGVQPVNGEPVEISVNGLATYVTYETIKANIPANVAADYDCAKKNYDIEKDGTVTVNLQKKASAKPTKQVMIRYHEGTLQLDSGEFTDFINYQDVEEDATKIDLTSLNLRRLTISWLRMRQTASLKPKVQSSTQMSTFRRSKSLIKQYEKESCRKTAP